MDKSPTNKSLISSILMTSKVDSHLRESNLNYVMRRSTMHSATGGLENSGMQGGSKATFRNATQIVPK